MVEQIARGGRLACEPRPLFHKPSQVFTATTCLFQNTAQGMVRFALRDATPLTGWRQRWERTPLTGSHAVGAVMGVRPCGTQHHLWSLLLPSLLPNDCSVTAAIFNPIRRGVSALKNTVEHGGVNRKFSLTGNQHGSHASSSRRSGCSMTTR